MDTYQPVFDAVRSRITGCDVGQILRDAIPSLDTWAIVQAFQSAASDVATQLTRPSIMLRLIPAKDGNQWCVLYGENLQEGIAGFGDTPDKAMTAFDVAWHNEKAAIDAARKEAQS
jgi:hypothetical protein